MFTTKTTSSLTAAGLLLLFAAPHASAYHYSLTCGKPLRWPLPVALLRISMISFPPTYQSSDAISRAVLGWNKDVPAQAFQFVTQGAFSDAEAGDGNNDVMFTYDYPWDDATLAVTVMTTSCAGIEDADVFFNPNQSWNNAHHPQPSLSEYGPYKLALVALHEFGHALGLQHYQGWMATMNKYYPSGGVLGNEHDPDPLADDCMGVRFLYGSFGTAHDLAASIYQPTIEGSAEVIVPPSSGQRDHYITVRFTILNRGTVKEPLHKVKLYASTSGWISTADYFLGSATFSQNAGNALTYDFDVKIPWSVPPGSYYLGLVSDPNGAISESQEDQNAVGYIVKTTIQ